ncbi:MAG: hypothetical protein WDM94_01560 [Bauldia sp.]
MDLIEDLPSTISAKLADLKRPGEQIVIAIKGAFKEALVCTDARVMVIKAGFMTGNTFGANVFQLPYGNITSVEVKFGMTGYFELSSGGVQNTKKSYWTNGGDGDAKKAPNSISLNTREQAEKFARAAEFILNRIANPPTAAPPGSAPAVSLADEISKLAALLEKGYLSKEEFEQQKLVLLARPAPVAVTPSPPPPSVRVDSDSGRPPDNIDRAIAEALRSREAAQANAATEEVRPAFGRRPQTPR